MKKVLLGLILVLGLFTGCISDSDYINTVKGISFNNGMSVEDIAVEDIKGMEFFYKNDFAKLKNDPMFAVYLYSVKFLESLKLPEEPKLKWKIEGKTENGKTVVAYTDDIEVRIQTRKNGDYIETSLNNISVYSVKNQRKVSDEDLKLGIGLYKTLLELKRNGVVK